MKRAYEETPPFGCCLQVVWNGPGIHGRPPVPQASRLCEGGSRHTAESSKLSKLKPGMSEG